MASRHPRVVYLVASHLEARTIARMKSFDWLKAADVPARAPIALTAVAARVHSAHGKPIGGWVMPRAGV